MKKMVFAALGLLMLADYADAQCSNGSCGVSTSRRVVLARRTQQTYAYQPAIQWSTPQPNIVQPGVVVSAPVAEVRVEVVDSESGLLQRIRERRQSRLAQHDEDWEAAVEALDEVNELRAKHGLRPFIEDEGLTRAAISMSVYRSRRLIRVHANDHAALPSGVTCTAVGCAAWFPDWGWGSCCDGVHTPDHGATYAGAAWTIGQDGRRYMHLFVR